MLDKILFALGVAADIAKAFGGPVAVGSALAAKFVAIAQAANAAHKAATGEDIDPAKLGQLPLIP